METIELLRLQPSEPIASESVWILHGLIFRSISSDIKGFKDFISSTILNGISSKSFKF